MCLSDGDVPNAYVKAATEDGLTIYLFIPQGMKFKIYETELAVWELRTALSWDFCWIKVCTGLNKLAVYGGRMYADDLGRSRCFWACGFSTAENTGILWINSTRL
ncbi:hypothetical protein PHMEG_0002671 [Phytophthora megakarya]|uniref:Uncharacterized protein n=1 Tax=Phytophthora megakarya TaxID=4795 RepID=A0A225WXT6_9STRA|nr:hypothetical protein PHMEG_0002671 [Phytophthora megakarya]